MIESNWSNCDESDWKLMIQNQFTNKIINWKKKFINVSIQYRDIMSMIQFFFDHSSFVSNLAYISLCQYNDRHKQIYKEMHTIDWWWQTQDQLSSKTTIVSLMITTDKTMFIQHHDDLKTWSVYLTIENLKYETRKNQTRFVNLLLKFISIAKKKCRKNNRMTWNFVDDVKT